MQDTLEEGLVRKSGDAEAYSGPCLESVDDIVNFVGYHAACDFAETKGVDACACRQGQSLRCGGSDHYQCSSQAEALSRCQDARLTLCDKAEIDMKIGDVCAYMWTSSSSTHGYYIGSGSSGCGTQGTLHESTTSYSGAGMFDAACCPRVAFQKLGDGFCGTDLGNGWPAYMRTFDAVTLQSCKDACETRMIEDRCRGIRYNEGDSQFGTCFVYLDEMPLLYPSTLDGYQFSGARAASGPITHARDAQYGGVCYRYNAA